MSKRIQVSGARSFFFVLLTCLGLGAFVSPAAAQWNGLPFNAPVFAQNGITMGNGITDSYNSDLGPYNPATAGSNGDLATNASISLSGTVVHGDATAVGTITGGTVTGTKTQNAPPFPSMPILPCPTGGYSILPTPFPSGVSYNAGSGDLVVGGGNTYTLNVPPSQYYFHSISLTGGSTLSFNNPSGKKVDIFLADGLTIGGGGVGNTSGLPTRLGFWACGSPASPTKWDLSGGSTGYFSLYAPNHEVRVGGSGGQIFGAVVAATFSASSNASFHFDEALLNEGLPTYGISVAPYADTVSHPAGTNYTESFTVQNLSNVSDSYDLLTSARPGTALTITSITGTGVTQGANPDSARLANLAVNATATVTVHYSIGSGAGSPRDTLLFTARSVASPSTSANGRLTVTVLGYGTSVAPHATTTSNLPSNGTNYTASFTVQNVGTGTASYDLLTKKRPGTVLATVKLAGTGVTQGTNPDSARLASLAGGALDTVTVTYSVGNVAAGTIDTLIFTARSVSTPATSDSGRLTLTVVRPSLTMGKAVSPSGSLAPGTVLSYTLTVTNGGTSNASGVALVDTLAAAVQFKVGSVTTTLPAGVTALVQYAKVGDTTWTYVPASAACSAPAGYDRCVNRIRWQLQNPLSYSAPNNAGTLQFVAQIR